MLQKEKHMGSIKILAIAFVISSGIILFITSEKVRRETFDVLNHKIGKSNIRIYNIFVILIVLILILYGSKILYKLKLLASLKYGRKI